jgi:hypothetical protein
LGEDHGDLKKQSQFAAAELASSLCIEKGYGGIPAGGTGENKANWSQFDVNGLGRGEDAPALRASQ